MDPTLGIGALGYYLWGKYRKHKYNERGGSASIDDKHKADDNLGRGSFWLPWRDVKGISNENVTNQTLDDRSAGLARLAGDERWVGNEYAIGSAPNADRRQIHPSITGGNMVQMPELHNTIATLGRGFTEEEARAEHDKYIKGLNARQLRAITDTISRHAQNATTTPENHIERMRGLEQAAREKRTLSPEGQAALGNYVENSIANIDAWRARADRGDAAPNGWRNDIATQNTVADDNRTHANQQQGAELAAEWYGGEKGDYDQIGIGNIPWPSAAHSKQNAAQRKIDRDNYSVGASIGTTARQNYTDEGDWIQFQNVAGDPELHHDIYSHLQKALNGNRTSLSIISNLTGETVNAAWIKRAIAGMDALTNPDVVAANADWWNEANPQHLPMPIGAAFTAAVMKGPQITHDIVTGVKGLDVAHKYANKYLNEMFKEKFNGERRNSSTDIKQAGIYARAYLAGIMQRAANDDANAQKVLDAFVSTKNGKWLYDDIIHRAKQQQQQPKRDEENVDAQAAADAAAADAEVIESARRDIEAAEIRRRQKNLGDDMGKRRQDHDDSLGWQGLPGAGGGIDAHNSPPELSIAQQENHRILQQMLGRGYIS